MAAEGRGGTRREQAAHVEAEVRGGSEGERARARAEWEDLGDNEPRNRPKAHLAAAHIEHKSQHHERRPRPRQRELFWVGEQGRACVEGGGEEDERDEHIMLMPTKRRGRRPKRSTYATVTSVASSLAPPMMTEALEANEARILEDGHLIVEHARLASQLRAPYRSALVFSDGSLGGLPWWAWLGGYAGTYVAIGFIYPLVTGETLPKAIYRKLSSS